MSYLVDFAKGSNAWIFLALMFIQQAFNVYYALAILLDLMIIEMNRKQTVPTEEER